MNMSMNHTLTKDELKFSESRSLTKTLFGVGIVALIISFIGYFLDSEAFFFSYLTSYVFFASLALGALFFILLQYLTRATWSLALIRIPEAISSNIFIWALFLIPVLFGLHSLYEWTQPLSSAGAHAELLAHKKRFLNIPFFIVRQVIYFTIWGFLGWRLYRISIEMDRTGDWGLEVLRRRTSGPGMFLFAITMAFASFDWLMSLDYTWYSTIFGVYFFAMSVQAVFCLLILAVIFFWKKGYLSHVIKKAHMYDLGEQLLGFTVFYAYIAFAQFLLIYYANIPEETVWFIERLSGGYQWLGYFFMICRIPLPFFILLNKDPKSNPKVVGSVAALILFSHLVELYWLIMPAFHAHSLHFTWLIIPCLVGLGCMFAGFFFYRFGKELMVPVNAPQLEESLHSHEHVNSVQ